MAFETTGSNVTGRNFIHTFYFALSTYILEEKDPI